MPSRSRTLSAKPWLSAKARLDYRHYADDYVRPLPGAKKLHDLRPDALSGALKLG